ncbi:hypothetical protein C3L33_03096, partial [Rhododendron williamsianum]
MDSDSFPPDDLERSAAYTRLPDHPPSPADHRRSFKGLAGIFLSMLLMSSLVALIVNLDPRPRSNVNDDQRESTSPSMPESLMPLSRGVAQGVSEKAVGEFSGGGPVYPWTNAMLAWQRTGYHFQPEKNWMNGTLIFDSGLLGKHALAWVEVSSSSCSSFYHSTNVHDCDSDRPLYHLGWYHLFYQYNPDSAVWGNITWGHAVSRDLIHWLYLPIALVPSHWFDLNGVWTGSATLLPDGQIIMLYTGDTDNAVQVQNLAYPANLSDPLLLDWVKYEQNPVIVPPPGIGLTNFRDPSTACFELMDGVMHAVPGTGMWECIDFYPVSTNSTIGLDTSVIGPDVKHVLKASLDDDKKDFYALGSYDPSNNTWTPDDPELDVGIGLRMDYGKFYASKTFYDQTKQRRILWGWIGETDNAGDDLLKGWACVQTIPRTIEFDVKTGTNVLQWPVEEVEELRLNATEYQGVELEPGSVVPLNITSATQLDISATFEVDEAALEGTFEADVGYNCSTAGSSVRGALGPFGLLVIADDSLSEFTAIYFYIAKDTMAVDHSIVESFAQGGRTVVTSRIYPTKAIYGAARAFLFNNATGANVTASVKIWTLDSAYIHPYPLDNMYEV